MDIGRGLLRRFNTQPPEGGWEPEAQAEPCSTGFNTQPPEGGWVWQMRT